MSFTPSAIATLATGTAFEDLRILLASLEIFNEKPPTVYLFCDSPIANKLASFKYSGEIVTKVALNEYLGLNRAKMEALPGKKYSSLFFDFMMEKLALLRWAFTEQPNVMFCDADICFLGPVPALPAGTTLALSQHMIRQRDEDRFGRYNGGFMWLSSVAQIDRWEAACADSRFFEQAALEKVPVGEKFYSFPVTQNYGWWRLWQGSETPQNLLARWSVNNVPRHAGILVGGLPLGSVHTHFHERRDDATRMFNEIVIDRLKKAGSDKARKLLAVLGASM
jgi:hypothetical protein